LSLLLFGALYKIAEPPSKSNTSGFDPSPELYPPSMSSPTATTTDAMEHVHAHFIEGTRDAAAVALPSARAPAHQEALADGVETIKKNFVLTDIFPDPGYFAAGAVAGIVSRTSTAPLDRLKVYLIASVGNAKGSLDAVKKGDAAGAARHLGQPLIDASKDIWRNGGIRNLFAGKTPFRTC
jgi:solute carrier family 25 phosphate transporter 23/24/25/41